MICPRSATKKVRNEGEYKEFRIGDLFDIHPTKAYNMTNDSLFSIVGKTPVVANSAINNGIGGYSCLKPTELGNKIVYSDTTTSDSIFYQPFDFIGYPHVQGLYAFSDVWDEYSLLYFVTCFRKSAFGRFNYGNKFTRVIAKDMLVSLPVTKTGEIDYFFMSSRIRELEEERIRELSAYLTVSGLVRYDLSDDEINCLEAFRNGKMAFKEFRIGDLYTKVDLEKKKFDKRKDTALTKNDDFSVPLVNAKHGDNGIMFYGKESVFDSIEMTIDIVQNGAIATGDVYPQPQRTGVLWDAYLIQAQNHAETENTLFYFSTAIQKTIKEKFSYEKKATWERVKNETIFLPITAGGKINYAFMETFIEAQKKIAIKTVVDWRDREIAVAKKQIWR